MKKAKLTSKLSLNKETVTKLNDAQMTGVKGGWLTIGSAVWSAGCRCTTGCTNEFLCNESGLCGTA
jgi:hypothetical protein